MCRADKIPGKTLPRPHSQLKHLPMKQRQLDAIVWGGPHTHSESPVASPVLPKQRVCMSLLNQQHAEMRFPKREFHKCLALMTHVSSPKLHPPEPRLYTGSDSLHKSKPSNSYPIYGFFIFALTMIISVQLLLHPLGCM